MSRLFFLLFLLLPTVARLQAQSFGPVFPSLSGQVLLDSLFDHYRPNVVLDYAHARDTLYAKVLAKDDDSLHCIYTNYALYLDPTQDPTQYVYLNGSALGINTEHAYPQAKGAISGTNAHSDMHHLFPARIPVNEARADKPFAEIPDAQTQKWFLGAQVFTSIPSQHIELYAESNADDFEPREAAKGDLARAIFYFYTMYRNQANTADPNFFELQRTTLCQWNQQDPADSAELVKTWRIAAYQEGKPNPYIVDCTLANRSWCPLVAPNCTVGTAEAPIAQNLGLRVLPQPVSGPAWLELAVPFAGTLRGRVWSAQGQALASFEWADVQAGTLRLPLDLPQGSLSTGWFGFLQVQLDGPGGHRMQTIPLVAQ
ncbi:MAG: endonuclease [Saprospiraceae bacterium]